MNNQRVVAAIALVMFIIVAGASTILLSRDSGGSGDNSQTFMEDPLLQDEGHDHRNASQHVMFTENIQPISFNALTAPGNAEVQVAESPDGKTYAYIAGWSEMHIVDVTNPSNLSLIHI